MFSRMVTVLCKGVEHKVDVPCVPSTSYEELKNRAVKILNKREEKRSHFMSKRVLKEFN